jgi:APA family basic amino acid/polyamine antiporter
MSESPRLRRTLTTWTLTLYGVGVMVGAGIYVLVGKVVGLAGQGAWASLVIAPLAALPTALSYAELSSRYPKSGGEAVFADRAFGRRGLSFVVGFLILSSGIVSTAAMSHGFASYFLGLVEAPAATAPLVIVVFLTALSVVNFWGIREATGLNVFATVVSVGALVLICVVGSPRWANVDPFDFTAPLGPNAGGVPLLAAAALAFYAYIGFEDICNVAEEVIDPERTIPKATVLSLAITSALYVGVSLTVVGTLALTDAATSSVPLALVAERLLPGLPRGWLNVAALFAVLNTALLNLVMASRIIYGMARSGLIPSSFGVVHERRRTPIAGVGLSFLLAVAVALTGVLEILAQSTSAMILIVFFVVNLSLLAVRLKRVPPDDPSARTFRAPIAAPVLGAATSLFMAAQLPVDAFVRMLAFLALGGLLYLATQVRRAPSAVD